MKSSFAQALFIDLRRGAGALENGHFRHSGRRYALFGAFSGVQSCCADRARSERYYGCPSGTYYGSSALPRPWGVPGPNIWRNIAVAGTIQIRTPSETQEMVGKSDTCLLVSFFVSHSGFESELYQRQRYFAIYLARAPPTA